MSKKQRGKTASFQAEIRLLSTPLHLAWFIGLAVLTVALLGLPMTMDWDTEIFFVWFLWGAIILGMMAYLPAGEFGDAEDIQEATGVTIVLLSIGVPALAVGRWACTQFWRSGEDIRTGESAA